MPPAFLYIVPLKQGLKLDEVDNIIHYPHGFYT